ncbi:hypothetical protein NA57DRAFT_40005 [Rhizodiscina lignyota]|uniref:Stress response protein rds1p n=1 Tax=Rhizodiscina lignyota TaxID=1504668 RepID=A0A9P4ICG6_9PEZI|nr:hypothetical protein NA57DRAFT_40005 [Rhizodiscina lignyota]
MYFSTTFISVLVSSSAVFARPNPISNPSYGPVPGQSALYNTYRGKAPPFPATFPSAVLPTKKGPPGPDDLLFQNLLSAEWIIYSFYQTGVEVFNASSFTAIGMPNNTYDRITEIRDNEAGHLRIFQDQISATSIKPGKCEYDFGVGTDAELFLAIQLLLELASMAFLTGLEYQAKSQFTHGALLAIAEVETRHNTWALDEIWRTGPFSGPSDTVFPYANQILDSTNQFVLPGSCPKENPEFPSPSQHLPQTSYNDTTSEGHPGDEITFIFTEPENQPHFDEGKDYYAVFFHSVSNISVPFDTKTNCSKIPSQFDAGRGLIVAVIADEVGAPTEESVVAGPALLLQQPEALTATTGKS